MPATTERTCRDCGASYDLSDLPRDRDVNWDRCPDCNRLVYAVGPINGEGPWFVAYDLEELARRDGDTLSLGQCSNCGGCEYRYEHARHRVVCVGDDVGDGCGAVYGVHQYRAYSVVF